jgi:hypothetical protein
MKFKQFLLETRKKNVIIVDVQPMYEQSIDFEIEDFNEFLLNQKNLLYFFNGPDTVGVDSKRNIIDWLSEYSDYNDDLYIKLTKQTIWYDKGYGFFRSWMDQGASHNFIKKAIRFMMSKKENDSRDIDPDEWKEKFPKDWKSSFNVDPIYLPDIPLNILKKFSGSYLVGGGKNECLKEIQILMSIFNIKYTLVNDFVY